MVSPLYDGAMVKALAACAACAALVGACGTGTPQASSSPSVHVASADSPAADLRAHMSLLLGEHTVVFAKLSVAAAGGRKDEYHAYAELLAESDGAMTSLFSASAGATEGAQLGQTWAQGDNFFVDYTVASVTRDQAAAASAMSGLTTSFAPDLAQRLASTLQLSSPAAMQVANEHVATTKAFIDDAVAGNFSKMYVDLRVAYSAATGLGDVAARSIVRQFADRFPGDATGKAADFRTTFDGLLQEQAYLVTMATAAAAMGSQGNTAAAGNAVATNTTAVTTLLGGIFGDASGAQAQGTWTQEAQLLVAYAKGGDPAVRQNAVSDATPRGASPGVYTIDLSTEIAAILHTIDDQRAKSYDRLAQDDRAAAALLAAAGDAITAAAVKVAPSKFV
jgi:hypothetical protein